MIAKETKLYNVEKSGASINKNKDRIEKFLGIQMLNGNTENAKVWMYWSQKTCHEPIPSTLSLKRAYSIYFISKRYKKICEFLHVADNSEKEKEENKR